jgi:hypothetical protein
MGMTQGRHVTGSTREGRPHSQCDSRILTSDNVAEYFSVPDQISQQLAEFASVYLFVYPEQGAALIF